MNYPPWWRGPSYEYPQTPVFFVPPTDRQKTALDAIKELEEQIEGLKKFEDYMKNRDKKETDKNKRKRSETPKFSFLETLSLLLLGSIPVALGQIYLLKYVATTLHVQ